MSFANVIDTVGSGSILYCEEHVKCSHCDQQNLMICLVKGSTFVCLDCIEEMRSEGNDISHAIKECKYIAERCKKRLDQLIRIGNLC